MLYHVNAFVEAMGHKRGAIDVGPACRALEADIICTIFFTTDPWRIQKLVNTCLQRQRTSLLVKL